jgi:hypothetical protein
MRIVVGAVLLAAFSLFPAAGGGQTAAFDLQVSTSPDRSSPTPLAGATVAGDIHVFTSPDTGTSRVRFWLDDPGMSGAPDKVETRGPWDFAGSASNGSANPSDTTRIPDGTHSITAEITLSAGGTEVVTSQFTVANGGGDPPPPPPSDHTLVVSTSPDRSSPVPLAGQSVADDIYVFTNPATGTSQVRFWLDDPGMTGSPDKVEKGGPWDFAGSASNGSANPYDTTRIPDGTHSITAEITLSAGGTEIVTSQFNVTNAGPALVLDRAAVSFALLPGNTSASETVSLSSTNGSAAGFSASDNAPWLQVTPANGSTPAELELAASASGLAIGTYTATVTATAAGYGPASLTVSLSVRDSLAPDQVHLSWVDEPSTTLTVVWRTWDTATPSTVQYRLPGAATWQSATGALKNSGTDGTLHEATVTGLSPSTQYEYRVRGDGSTWSTVYTAKTAPPPGPADFDAIYVADTGLVGREDGLATGTQQVVDEIAALSPDLVLLGGDYAYFNTDKRYGTLDDTIDAWFNQMQPIGSRSPMMPTYGNHEVLLGEGFEPWAQRFATPAGFDGRRFYSFDVGDVHFVSLLAVTETNGLSSSALTWIENDIEAAQAAGQRWIVPFFHVSPFSDGSSHPSNLGLRNQLGPLFERLGVKIAIASHDQSYERTFPLVNVPSSNTPTSTGKRCYTMDDGVTWVKVSPGGKLSNKNGNFSQWRTHPAPAWTAFRDNTMHHFSRLVVSANGVMRLDTYGVVGDGTPPVIIDSFEYRETCPAELRFNRETITVNAQATTAPISQPLSLAAVGGSAATYSVSNDAPWLTVSPQVGSTPANLTVTVDPSGLAAGSHHATITATAPGHVAARTVVTLNVYDLLMSTSPDRSSPAPLAGRTVSGRIYPFTAPDAVDIAQVRFWLDNPTMSGTPRKTEGNRPYDFAGTAASGAANPFDTRTISNGPHTITASIDFVGGGSQVVSRTFTVSN